MVVMPLFLFMMFRGSSVRYRERKEHNDGEMASLYSPGSCQQVE